MDHDQLMTSSSPRQSPSIHRKPMPSEDVDKSPGLASVAYFRQMVVMMSELCEKILQQMEAENNTRKLTEIAVIPHYDKPTGEHLEFVQSAVSVGIGHSDEKHTRETEALKTRMKELVDMNVKWQAFHGQQEKHMAELRSEVERLQKQLEQVQKRSDASLSETQQQEIDRLLLTQKHKLYAVEEEKQKIEGENQQLRRQLEESQRMVSEHLATIDTLLAGAETLKTDIRKMACSQQDVQVLETQITLYREDFEAERRDREVARSRVAELEQQLEEYRAAQVARTPYYQYPQIAQPSQSYQSKLAINRAYPNYENLALHQPERYGRVPLYQTDHADGVDESDSATPDIHRSLVGRGLMMDGEELLQQRVEPVAPRGAEAALRCPKCHKAFTTDEQLELVDHIDTCSR